MRWQDIARKVLAGPNAGTALWAIGQKAPIVSALEASSQQVSAVIMESCWWIASLDDLITTELDGQARTSYRQAQQADDSGRVVPGIRWARHRHSHQLAVETVRPGRIVPLTQSEGSSPLQISSSWQWHTVAEMRLTEADLQRSRSLQPAYEQHVAGYPVREILYSALRWFNGIRT